MANEEKQSNYSGALDKFVGLVVSSVDTNHGEWKDSACVYGMLPDNINPGDTKESRDLYLQFCAGLSNKLIETILPCLVTAHNLNRREELE